jgi:hypothetical protein
MRSQGHCLPHLGAVPLCARHFVSHGPISCAFRALSPQFPNYACFCYIQDASPSFVSFVTPVVVKEMR